MSTLHWTVTALIIALGMLQVGFTRLNYARFDMDAMWFLGSLRPAQRHAASLTTRSVAALNLTAH